MARQFVTNSLIGIFAIFWYSVVVFCASLPELVKQIPWLAALQVSRHAPARRAEPCHVVPHRVTSRHAAPRRVAPRSRGSSARSAISPTPRTTP